MLGSVIMRYLRTESLAMVTARVHYVYLKDVLRAVGTPFESYASIGATKEGSQGNMRYQQSELEHQREAEPT